MPYANREEQRDAQARWYREKYRSDRKFRQSESDRKADWLQTPEGKQSNAEASARFQAKQKREAFAPRSELEFLDALKKLVAAEMRRVLERD